MKASITSYQERTQSASEQLEQCFLELQAIQADKQAMEQKNQELTQELTTLQNTFTNLNIEHDYRIESVASLEVELNNARSSRHEICMQSRNVVENVRAWLQEQKKINEQLNGKMREKNNAIKKLKFERE